MTFLTLKKFILSLGVILVLLFFNSCDNETEYIPPDSSFGLIYTNIFQPTCGTSGCHDGNTTFPTLSGESTYSSIVGTSPLNAQAQNAGLQVIIPNNADSSFLYQKLIFDTSNFQFGAKMPVGGLTVSDDAIEFVRQWIEAGAPETGHVADRTLIE